MKLSKVSRTEKEEQVLAWSNLISLGNLSSPQHIEVTVQNQDVLSLTYSKHLPWPSVNEDLSILISARRIRIRQVAPAGVSAYTVYLIPQDLEGFESQVLAKSKISKVPLAKIALALRHLLFSLHVNGHPISHQDLSMHSLMDAWKAAIQTQNVSEEQLARLPDRSRYVADIIRDVERETGPLEETLSESLTLMQYQRATVAQMIYRENQADQLPDVTLSPFKGKEGNIFYMDSAQRIQAKRATYSAPCGGILADLPGSGKSLICLALMAATKGIHAQLLKNSTLGQDLPTYLESDHEDDKDRIRPGSLLESCTRKAALHSAHLARYKTEEDSPKNLVIDSLKRMRLCYNRPDENERRSFLNSISDGGRPSRHGGGYKYQSISDIPTTRIRLSKTSLFVVPDNLLDSGKYAVGQWEVELQKHFRRVGGRPATLHQDEHPAHIRYLVLRGGRSKAQVPSEDVLAEFDLVLMAQSLFSRMKSDSPLLRIHFVRLVVDEGHFVASANSKKSDLASRILAQARWVISATPTTNLNHTEKISGEDRVVLAPGRNGYDRLNAVAESDLGKLGRIAAFLRMTPFCEDKKAFDEYMAKGFLNGYGFMKLAKFMKQIVIRNDPDDIKQQMDLPPLDYQIVTLPWSLLPRLSMNALLAIFLYNAISSEEEDRDFLFAEKNRKWRGELFVNIREAHVFLGRAEFFVWVERASQDLHKDLDDIERCRRDGITSKYDAKKEIKLRELGQHFDAALDHVQWRAAVKSQDLPLLVSGAPSYIRHLWSLERITGEDFPQQNSHQTMLMFADTIGRLKYQVKSMRQSETDLSEDAIKERLEHLGNEHAHEFSVEQKLDPTINARMPFKHDGKGVQNSRSGSRKIPDVVKKVQNKSKAKKDEAVPLIDLPAEILQDLQMTKIDSTASSLINWIINQIKSAPNDRFLIFASSGYVRYELGWALTFAQISCFQKHPQLEASDYQKFQNGERQVLVMDPEQGGRGLDLRGANRTIFVDPPPRQDLELQAMLRSHRLGQTRKVTVQLLVMEHSFHAKLLEWRNAISATSGNEIPCAPSDDRNLLSQLKQLNFIPAPADEDLSSPDNILKAMSTSTFTQKYDLFQCLSGPNIEDQFENQLYPKELRTDEEIEALQTNSADEEAAAHEEHSLGEGFAFGSVKDEPQEFISFSSPTSSVTPPPSDFDQPLRGCATPPTELDDVKEDVDMAETLMHLSGQTSATPKPTSTIGASRPSFGFGRGRVAGRPKAEPEDDTQQIDGMTQSGRSRPSAGTKRKAPAAAQDAVKRKKQKKQKKGVTFAE